MAIPGIVIIVPGRSDGSLALDRGRLGLVGFTPTKVRGSDAGQESGNRGSSGRRRNLHCRRKNCPCGKSRKCCGSGSNWACARIRSPAVVRSRKPVFRIASPGPGRRASDGRLGKAGTRRGWKKRSTRMPVTVDPLGASPFKVTPSTAPPKPQRPTPDFAHVHQELQSHRRLTLLLLWEEYRQNHPDGYGYSHFCELYHRWHRHLDVVLRHEHKAGEKLFVDYAGDTIPIFDPKEGSERKASIFVAVLGASSYTYAEATWSQGLEDWLGAHVRALEFLGGVPELVVPDNTKTGVRRACRYEPDLNPAYQEMAQHYGVGVVPARPYRPRDKAKVEGGVLLVERWIVAALRHRKFFSLAELNQAIRDLL